MKILAPLRGGFISEWSLPQQFWVTFFGSDRGIKCVWSSLLIEEKVPKGLLCCCCLLLFIFVIPPPTPQPPLFKPYPALCALRLLRLRGWSHAGIFLPALTNSFSIIEELFAAWKQGLGRIGRMQVRGGFMLLLLFYPLNFCEQILIKHLQLYLDVCVCACICLCMQNRNTDQKLKKMTLWKVLGKKSQITIKSEIDSVKWRNGILYLYKAN